MSQPSPVYRSSTAAHWMPRTLAVAILLAGLIAGQGVEPQNRLMEYMRFFFMLTGLAGAIWIVRGGAEVRTEASVDDHALRLRIGARQVELELDGIERIEFQTPFSTSRQRWLPAAAFIDRFGHGWRLPATIEDGGALIDDVVRRSGNDELATWSDALGIVKRMSRPHWTVWTGYALSGAIVVGSLLRAWL